LLPTFQKPNAFYFILLLGPFIKPVLVESYSILNLFYMAWKLLSLAYLIVVLLPNYLCFHPKKHLLGIAGLCLFWLIFFIGCVVATADIFNTFIAAISAILCFLLISQQAQMGNGWILLKGLNILFTVLILIHAATVFLLPVQASTIFFLGMDNYSAFFIYPMLFVILFYHSLRYGKLRLHSWLMVFLVIFLYIYTSSYTAAAAGLLFIALISIYPHWHKLPKLRGVRWLILLLILVLFLIVEFEIQNLLASLLDSMSKGTTLNSRTIIWDFSLKLIVEKPIFGHGSFTQAQNANLIPYGSNHAQHLILELLLRTGIVGTIAYLTFLCGFTSAFKKSNSETCHNYILIAGLLSQLVLSFMDFYPTILVFYIFMAIIYNRYLFSPPPNQIRR